MRKVTLTIATLLMMVLVGCATISDAITPCQIDKEALAYTGEPKTGLLPFPTILDAKRVGRRLDYMHAANQLKLYRQIEDDSNEYDYILGVSRNHMQVAKEFQDKVFNPQHGVIPTVLTLMGVGAGALAFKRPGDVSQGDHRTKVNEAGKADPKKFQAIA